ncbi:unnamed protein product [Mytilus coruscus]|uniref:Uncharacterized protein n=1 Tax=Mytilus coruscus TaxID=42192 RepID=A0A6J8C785_MYTCO|nr:unnamed protein product [Mytilus coruscus]
MLSKKSKQSRKEIKQVNSDTVRQLQDTVLDIKCRSMKNNLICSGLGFQADEHCEEKIQNFVQTELGKNYKISFWNVNRFGKKGMNGVRPIMARFVYRREMEHVLSQTYRLKVKPFGICEQFPPELKKKRKELYPIMKEAIKSGKNISLELDNNNKDDRHFIGMITNKIAVVLTDSATTTFGTKNMKSTIKNVKPLANLQHKPWFNKECKTARSAHRKFKRCKRESEKLRKLAKTAERHYEKVLNKAQKRYRNDFRKKMDQMRSGTPKEFWKILNEQEISKQPDICFDEQFFKELNSQRRYP